MKLFGHPIHIMIIHFPTVLLPMDILFSFLTYYTKNTGFLNAAFYCLEIGVLSGALALLTGLADLLAIDRTNKPAMATALIHGFINLSVLLVFAIFAFKSWQLYPNLAKPQLASLVVKTVMILVLFVGNYLGGKLILSYHLGIHKGG